MVVVVDLRSQAKWQMTSVCESPSRCSYFDVCHTQTVEEKKLSQVAYLGRSDHAFLLNLRDKLVQYVPGLSLCLIACECVA